LPVLYWLFCENHQLFLFFQKPRTRGSLDCENTKKTGTGGFFISEINPEPELIKNKIKELHNTGCVLRFGQHQIPDGNWFSVQGIHISCH
jgi:hypothetical protein